MQNLCHPYRAKSLPLDKAARFTANLNPWIKAPGQPEASNRMEHSLARKLVRMMSARDFALQGSIHVTEDLRRPLQSGERALRYLFVLHGQGLKACPEAGSDQATTVPWVVNPR